MLAAWRDQPLAQLPFRHSYAAGQGIVHIHRDGPVTLALVLVEPDAARAPRTIAFSDCDRREVVLAGQGAAVGYTRRDGAPPVAKEVRLAPGTVLTADADNSRAIAVLDAPLVLLRVRDRRERWNWQPGGSSTAPRRALQMGARNWLLHCWARWAEPTLHPLSRAIVR